MLLRFPHVERLSARIGAVPPVRCLDVLGRTIPSSVLVHRPLEVRNRERRDSR
jgi:hypothetical protein